MKQHCRRPRATRSRLAFVAFLGALGCAEILGIDPAEVDPTLDDSLLDPTQLTSDPAFEEGLCQTFDNRTRLTRTGPDGALLPLPNGTEP
jgi:hypothetical protein